MMSSSRGLTSSSSVKEAALASPTQDRLTNTCIIQVSISTRRSWSSTVPGWRRYWPFTQGQTEVIASVR
jgi:hypothetical protein